MRLFPGLQEQGRPITEYIPLVDIVNNGNGEQISSQGHTMSSVSPTSVLSPVPVSSPSSTFPASLEQNTSDRGGLATRFVFGG